MLGIFASFLRDKGSLGPAFLFSLCCALLVFSSALFADRIKMLDGRVLRGKVIKITAKGYTFRKTDGSLQNVAKAQISKVTFTGKASEKAYVDYFARAYWGMGIAAYSEEGIIQSSTGRPFIKEQKSLDIPLRLGLEMGWMAIANSLAVHGGLEHNQSQVLQENDLSYSYLNLTAGVSWYFAIDYLGINLDNLYLRPQIRLPLQGSVRSSSEDQIFGSYTIKQKNAPLEGEGLSYGLSLGKEWLWDSFVWGLALSYSVDNFQVKRSDTLAALEAVPATVQYYGIDFSISYD